MPFIDLVFSLFLYGGMIALVAALLRRSRRRLYLGLALIFLLSAGVAWGMSWIRVTCSIQHARLCPAFLLHVS